DADAAAHDRRADDARTLLAGTLNIEATGKDGKAHCLQCSAVPHAAAENKPSSARPHAGGGQHVAKRTEAEIALVVDDEHVARPATGDGGMDGQIVPRLAVDGKRHAGDLHAAMDRRD